MVDDYPLKGSIQAFSVMKIMDWTVGRWNLWWNKIVRTDCFQEGLNKIADCWFFKITLSAESLSTPTKL